MNLRSVPGSRFWITLGAVAVLATGAGATLGSGSGAGPVGPDVHAGHTEPPRLAAATEPPPIRVAGPAGRTIVCPRGAVPAVHLTDAVFEPPLAGGTMFAAGSYRITLRGVITNGTTMPITVRAVDLTVGGTRWRSAMGAPRTVTADTSVPIRVEGAYLSPRRGHADLRAALAWQWRDPALRSCGTAGLIEDD
ncbi:MAG: hypothetical protein HY241_01760 [Actinobacteria bacterium]|nr:hypothetical protein [Actinomycetota bacterium]